MRCGKETEDRAVFCAECLADMERYPVKPGTVIHIPPRQEPDPRKQTRKRKELTAEEQLAGAQNLIQILTICVLGLLSTLILTGVLLCFTISQTPDAPEETQPPMGRNYTITTPADTD